jgi:hypothetical protein
VKLLPVSLSPLPLLDFDPQLLDLLVELQLAEFIEDHGRRLFLLLGGGLEDDFCDSAHSNKML